MVTGPHTQLQPTYDPTGTTDHILTSALPYSVASSTRVMSTLSWSQSRPGTLSAIQDKPHTLKQTDSGRVLTHTAVRLIPQATVTLESDSAWDGGGQQREHMELTVGGAT